MVVDEGKLQLQKLVTAVANSQKYQHLSPDLVRRVGGRELIVRRSYKEALKATKNKLHQVGGAYLDSKINYEKALMRLQDAAAQPENLRETCRDLMRLHTSTRERLPIIDTFYSELFANLPSIHSVLDIASGLNPLALPWMPLAAGATYVACDIYADMMQFLQQAIPLFGVQANAFAQDVVSYPPTQSVDVAFILKTLPVLAQVDKTAVSRLLDQLNAKYMVISFPVRSLGGRSKGMAANYAAQFAQWKDGRNWHVQRFDFETELVYLIQQL
ncbi:MAG: 16S rRNA methyltransferase [Chloroflexi bacterium]|nr:16S rRNA methyltransferase [Chloroflexota bacterium]